MTASPTAAQITILVVNTSGPMRDLLRSQLTAVGMTQTYEAADGDEALAKIRDLKPEVVVCDLAIRPMDGIALTRHLRWSEDSPNPYQPIILLVGQGDHGRLEEVRQAGVSAVVTKPITAQNLVSHIIEIIENPRPFVRFGTYFGPDRRRQPRAETPEIPHRRREDRA